MRWRERETQVLIAKIAVAFVITGFVGLILDKAGYTLTENPAYVANALVAGGVAFIVL
jgi:undecaprenyl pyrophosphate phosphatase UppP